jgi:lysozyme
LVRRKIIIRLIKWAAPVLAAAFIFIILAGAVSESFLAAKSSNEISSSAAASSSAASAATLTGNVDGLPVSKNLIAFIESWEGYYATGYRGLDYWNVTIGYGHVELPGESFTSLTQPEAEQLLITDLQSQGYIKSVQKEFSGCTLSQNKFDALVDLAYGLGTNIWSSISLTGDIKSGASDAVLRRDFDALDYCNGVASTGLLRRREAEWVMFTQNKYVLNS